MYECCTRVYVNTIYERSRPTDYIIEQFLVCKLQCFIFDILSTNFDNFQHIINQCASHNCSYLLN